MRASPLLAGRAPQLLIGCVAAFVLHALFLSYWHLKRSTQPSPSRLHSKDNTPELLQFASQKRLLPSLRENSPLPEAIRLPPPTKQQFSLPGGSLKEPTSIQKTQKASELRKTPSPSNRTGGVVLNKRLLKDTSALPGAIPGHKTPPFEGGSVKNEASALQLVVSEKANVDGYQALWARAQIIPPGSLIPEEPSELPIEIRELPWVDGIGGSMKMQPQQVVLMGNHLHVFWKDRDKLLILKLKREVSSVP
jgi:hypothetical protein